MGTVGVLYALSPTLFGGLGHAGLIVLAILLVMLSGFLNAPSSIARRLLMQRNTPREMRGRIFSSFFVGRDVVFLLGMVAAGLADVIDVQILEVNRARAKQYGLNLNAYAIGLMFSPEVAPPNTSAPPTAPPPSPPPFNVNTISQGVSTADFYMNVPTALIRFLESDTHTKTIAKPQLRGAEGTKLTLNLGDDVPVLQTVFGAAATGGFATIPQSSYTYRSVGVNVEVTPRVTYDGEIVLELVIENSTLGGSIDVGGQSAPTFGTRKVTTKLRLREGESNLLAGLLRERDRRDLRGFPGLLRLPVFKQFLSDNDQSIEQTDIVMLLTPHIVRTHELTARDLSPIYIGTQGNLGLGGPPPLIAPPAGAEEPAPSVGTGPSQIIPTTPGVAPGGVPRFPVASDPGAQPVNRPPPPATSPVPTPIAPVPEKPVPAPPAPTTTAPPAGAPGAAPAPQPGAATTPPPDTAPTPPPAAPPPATAPTGPAGVPATPAQVIVTVPGTTFQVAGGPYTVPVSINNASRISVMTLTITYNPNVLRVRNVQDGTFLKQGGAPATFHMKIASSPMAAIEALQLDVAYVAVAKSLGLPTQSYMALSDAKTLDAQAGAETFGSALLAALAGVNSVSGPGMLDFLLVFSLPKLVFDDAMCGQVLHFVREVRELNDLPVHELIDRRVHFLRQSFCLNPFPLYCAHDLRTMLKLAHTQNHCQMAQLHFIPHKPFKPTFNMMPERRRDGEVPPSDFHRHASFQAEYIRPSSSVLIAHYVSERHWTQGRSEGSEIGKVHQAARKPLWCGGN